MHDKNSAIDQLLSAKEVGEMLSLSPRQIFRLRSSGKIPAPVRISGAVRWRLSDIQLFLKWNCPDREAFEERKNSTR